MVCAVVLIFKSMLMFGDTHCGSLLVRWRGADILERTVGTCMGIGWSSLPLYEEFSRLNYIIQHHVSPRTTCTHMRAVCSARA